MIEWLVLILLIPAILVPLVLLFGFAGCDLVFRLDPLPVFEEAFSETLTNERGFAFRTIVQRFEAGQLQKSGGRVRVVLARPTGANLAIENVYISQAAETGNPYDSGSDLTQVLENPILVPQDSDPNPGALELSDVEYPLDGDKPLLIAFDISTPGPVRFLPGIPDTRARAYIGPPRVAGDPPIHEAAVAARQPGYTPESRIYIVTRIDVAD